MPHFSFNQTPPLYINVVRDPVDRAVSFYYWRQACPLTEIKNGRVKKVKNASVPKHMVSIYIYHWRNNPWFIQRSCGGYTTDTMRFNGSSRANRHRDILKSGLILGFHQANVRRRYKVTPSLNGPLVSYVKCRLRMRRECRERFPRYRLQMKSLVSDPGMHHGTCVTHVPWCMSGSLTRDGGENVPGIPGACARAI